MQAMAETVQGLTDGSGCAFPVIFTGDVRLEEWMIPALRWVEKIEGYLLITDEPFYPSGAKNGLTTLSGVLPNLKEVTQGVDITTNPDLTSLDGLCGALQSVGGKLAISRNWRLTSVGTGFKSLITIGSLSFDGNGACGRTSVKRRKGVDSSMEEQKIHTINRRVPL